MQKVGEEDLFSSQMSISSEAVTSNIQRRKMKDDVIKSMTKEELDQFKIAAIQSKMKAT